MSRVSSDIPIWAKKGRRVWLEVRDSGGHEVLEYLPAVISFLDSAARTLKVTLSDSGDERQVQGSQLLDRSESEELVSDLGDIPVLNDAELLKFLHLRYARNMIHCFCGPTLIVVNPYKRIEREESDETRNAILKGLLEKRTRELPPHVWTVSALAFDFMLAQQRDQAICISGESGAGKTESTKRCLEFIAQMKGESRSQTYVPIEQKILSCNPLLEAFGNSKTFRNDNSSRFGKYTVLFVDRFKKNVRGASIQNYLLEKSRITNLAKEERCFHVFYAMCRFMPAKKKERYYLAEQGRELRPQDFGYLSQSAVFEVPKVNDGEFYEDICRALKDLDFAKPQRDAIWRILAAVLFMGNLAVDGAAFEEGVRPCAIRKDGFWAKVCALLGGEPKAFEEALTHKVFRVGPTLTKAPLAPAKVRVYIDTLARELYGRLFGWIVQKLNLVLLPKNPADPAFLTIGVLDIFGFEIFGKNSLEQLFINFANERLQGLYVDYIFKNECRIFEEEGLGKYTSLIVYKDNKGLVLALDCPKQPPGVFDLLDQTCALNKGDEVFFAELQKNHKGSEHVAFPKIVKNLAFTVRHTARDVEYLSDSFVDKNKEEFPEFLANFLQTCRAEVVGVFSGELGLPQRAKPETPEQEKGKGRQLSLGFKFRRDMDDLIGQLARCYCHFVRCLKPNELKKADLWNPSLALMQIRYMGLLDSLKIRKNSFPFRFTYFKFFEVFQDLDVSANGQKSISSLEREKADFEQLTRELLRYCGLSFTERDLLYGKTRIFLNERLKIELEKALLVKQRQKKEALKAIQELYKGFSRRKDVAVFMVRTHNSIRISRDLLRSWTAKLDGLRFRRLQRAVGQLQLRFRLARAKRQRRLKVYTMGLIADYLGLFKLGKIVQYLLYHKRKVQQLQAVLDKRVRESQVRFCRKQVQRCVELAWARVKQTKETASSLRIQRVFRGFLLRAQRKGDFALLSRRIEQSRDNRAAVNIQRLARGFLVKRRLLHLNRAVRRIQGFWRMRGVRKYFQRLRAATAVLQRFLRKHLLRQRQILQQSGNFAVEFGTLVRTVAQLEHDILFSDQERHANLQNVGDYTKLPFFQHQRPPDFGRRNYRLFVPGLQEFESLGAKARLFVALADLSVHTDSTSIYSSTWAHEFMGVVRALSARKKRLAALEVGETFSLAVAEDGEVFSWGLNDFGQCLRSNSEGDFSLGQGKARLLSGLALRALSAGNDHALALDEGNNLYVWGRNSEQQLGLGHNKRVPGLTLLNSVKEPVKLAVTKEGRNFALGFDGRVICWPAPKRQGNQRLVNLGKEPGNLQGGWGQGAKSAGTFALLEFPAKTAISALDVGCEFAVFLSSAGLLFASGSNEHGQLGLGHNEARSQPELVGALKEAGEKILEASCGNKHVIARANSGRVFCWGLNSEGQLGCGDLRPRNSPQRLQFSDQRLAKVFPRSVQAGFNCSLVLLENKQIYCMGKMGAFGQSVCPRPTLFGLDRAVRLAAVQRGKLRRLQAGATAGEVEPDADGRAGGLRRLPLRGLEQRALDLQGPRGGQDRGRLGRDEPAK